MLYRTASGTDNTAVCNDTAFGFFNVDLTQAAETDDTWDF